jgi:hypothetical protein
VLEASLTPTLSQRERASAFRLSLWERPASFARWVRAR